MSDSIKVAIKVRPLIKREKEDSLTIQWRVQGNSIVSTDPEMKRRGDGGFCFDHIFDMNASNSHVFDTIVQPIVDAAVNGFNGTVFAYGQTSSGKTFTMMGTLEEPGIIPLAIQYMFDAISNTAGREFLLRVSYLEIYNEKVNDLLNKTNTDLKLKEDGTGQVILKCKEEITNCPENVLCIMKKGDKNRRIGETNMNERSSRSHTIFRITIESREAGGDSAGAIQVSQLNLVDLAGSERARQTGATGERFKEGRHINMSLSTLGLVIMQLSESQDGQKHVNFRDSKLTRLLQTSLGGNAMTAIICAVTPAALEETQCTLSFASRAKSVKNKPQINEVMSDAALLKRYAKQMSKLEAELQRIKNENRSAEVEEMESKLQEKDRINQMLEERIELLKTRIVSGDTANHEDSFKCKAKRRQTWGGPGMFNQHLPFFQPKASLPTIQETSSTKSHRKSMIQSVDIMNQTFQTAFADFELELFESERDRDDRENGSDSEEESFVTKRKHRVTFQDDVLTIKSRCHSLDNNVTPEKCDTSTQTMSCRASPSTPKHVLRRCIVDLTREFAELREFTTLEKQLICQESHRGICVEESINLIDLDQSEKAIDISYRTSKSEPEKIPREAEYPPEVKERLKNLNLTEEQNMECIISELCTKLRDSEKENELEKIANQRTMKQFSELQQQIENMTSERNEFEHISREMRTQLRTKTAELELKNMTEESIKQPELNKISELDKKIASITLEKNNFERLSSELRNELTKRDAELQKQGEYITSERNEFEHIRRELNIELSKKSLEFEKLKNDPEGAAVELLENIAELKGQVENIRFEKNEIENVNKELQLKIAEEEKAKREAIEKVIDLEKQIEEFKTDKTECERVNGELKAELSQKTVDFESKIQAGQAENQRALDKMSELEKQMEQITSDKNEVERINNVLNQKTSEWEKQMEQITADKNGLERNNSELNQKTSELDKQMEQITSDKNEVERINNELNEKTFELEKQVEQITSDKNGLERLNSELNQKTSELERINSELNQKTSVLEKQVEEITSSKNKFEHINSELNEKTFELEKQVEQITSDKNGLERLNSELNQKTSELERINSELNQKTSALEKQVEEITSSKNKFEHINSELNEKTSELEKQVEQITSDKNGSERINSELNQKTSALEKQVEEITSSKNEFEYINSELNRKISELERINSELTQKSSEMEKQIQEITSSKNEFECINSELNEKTTELEKKVEEITANKNEFEHINSELNQKISELEKQMEQLTSNKNDFEGINGELNQNASALEKQIEEITSSKNEFERINSELNQKTSELEKQIVQITSDKNEFERINVELNQRTSELEIQMEQITSNKNDFEGINGELNQNTSALEKQIEEITSSKNELERINSELNQKSSELEKQIEEISSNKNELEHIHSELNQKTSELEKQIEQITSEKNEFECMNDELQQQLAQTTADFESKITLEQTANKEAMDKISALEKQAETIISDRNEFNRINAELKAELSKQSTDLESKVKLDEAANDGAIEKVSELEKQLEELKSELNQKTADYELKIQSDETVNKEAMEKVSELEKLLEELKSELNQKTADYELKIQSDETVNKEAMENISELEKQLEELKSELSQKTVDYELKIKSDETVNKEAMENISELEKQLEELKSELSQKTVDYELKIKSDETVNKEAMEKISELETKIQEITSIKNECEDIISHLESQLQQLTSDFELKIQSDESGKEEATEKILELEKQVENITAAKNEFERVNIRLQAKLNEKVTDIKSKVILDEVASEEALENMSQLEEQIERIISEKNEFERMNDELKTELSETTADLESKIQSEQITSQKAMEKISELENQIQEMTSVKNELERTIVELKTQLSRTTADLESKIESEQITSQKTAEKMSELENQIQEIISHKNELERVIVDLKSELSQKTTDFESKMMLERTSNQEIMEKLSELEEQIETLVLERTELERVRSELCVELDNKSSESEKLKNDLDISKAETTEKISKLEEEIGIIALEKNRIQVINEELESRIISEQTTKLEATEKLSELQTLVEQMTLDKLDTERVNTELQAQLNQKSIDLESKIVAEQTLNQEAAKKISLLDKQIEIIKTEKSELERVVSELRDELNQKSINLESKILAEEIANQKVEERISLLDKQIETITLKKNDLENVVSELRDELNQKSIDLESKNDSKYMNENNNLKSYIKDLQETIVQLQTESEDLGNESFLSCSNLNASNAETLLVNMEAEKSMLEDNLELKSQELEEIKNDVQGLKTAIENLQKTIYILTTENMEMATKLSTEQEHSKQAQLNLQKVIDELYIRISQVTNEKISLESDLTGLNDQLESLKSKLQEVHSEEQQFSNYRSKIDKLTAENIELSASIAEKNKELDSIKESKSLLFDHECIYKEKVSALTQKNKSLLSENNELSTDLIDKIEENDMLREQYDALQKRMEQSTATENDSEHLKSETNILRAEIAELKTKIAVLSEENTKFSNNLLETMENLDCSRSEKTLHSSNLLSNSLETCENEILQETGHETLMNKISALQKNVDHLTRLNQKLSDLKLTSCSQCAHVRNLHESRRAIKLEAKLLNKKLQDLQRKFDRKCADTEILKNKINQELNLSAGDSANVTFVDEMNVSFVENRIQCLNDELQTLRADHDKLSALYEDKCNELEQLNNGISDAKNGDTPKKNSGKNGGRIEQVQNHVDKLRDDIDDLKKNSTNFTGMLSEFRNEKASLLEEINILKSSNEELQQKVSDKENTALEKVQMLENELTNMSRDIEKFSVREKELEGQKLNLEVELEGLKLEEQKKNASINQLNERLSSLQNELATCKNNALIASDALESKYREELEKERLQRKDMESHAVSRVKELEANIENLQKHIENQERSRRELEEKGLQVQNLLQESDRAKQVLAQKLQALETEYTESKNNLETRYRSEFTAASSQYELRMKESETNLQKLNDSLNKYIDENLNLTQELSRLQVIEKQSNEKSLDNENQRLNEELNDIRRCMVKELRSLKCNINFADLSTKSANEVLIVLLQTLVSKEEEIMKSMRATLEKEKRKLEEEKQQSVDTEKRVTIWAKELETEIEKLQAELTEREQSQKDYQNKILQLEHLLRESCQEKQMLKEKMQELETDLGNLQVEFERQCKIDSQQEEAMVVAQKREQELQQIFQNKEVELQSKMKIEKDLYERELNELRYTIESYKTKQLELNSTVEGLEANEKQLKNIIDANSIEMKKKTQSIEKLSAELEQLTEARNEMSQGMEQKTTHINEITIVLKSKCDSLSEHKAKLETIVPEYEMLKEHVNDQKAAIEMYREEIEQVKKEREKQLELVKDKVISEEIKNAGLNKQLNELNNKNVALIEQLNDLKEKYEELQLANEKLERKIRNSTSKMKAAAEIEELKEVNKRLQSNLEGASNRVAQLQEIKNQTLKEYAEMQNKHELLLQENTEINKMLSFYQSKQNVSVQDDRFDALLQEKNKIALELEGKKLLLNQKDNELKDLASQVQQLQDQNKELDDELEDYAAVIRDRDSEISKLEEKLYSRLTENTVINELEEKLKTLKEENEKLRDKVDAHRMKMEATMEQTKDTTSQHEKLICALKKENLELKTKLTEYKKKTEMNISDDGSGHSMKQLQNNLESACKRVAELQEEKTRIAKELTEFKHKYELLTRENVDARKTLLEKSLLEKSLLNEQDKESRAHLSQVQEQMTRNKELDNELEKRKDTIRERDAEILNLQKKLQLHSANCEQILVNDLKTKLTAFKEENKKLRNEIAAVQVRSSEKVSFGENPLRKPSRSLSEKQISEYEEKCQQLKNKVHELELQLVSRNGKIATLEIKIQSENFPYQRKCKELEELLLAFRNKNAELCSEVRKLQRTMNDVNTWECDICRRWRVNRKDQACQTIPNNSIRFCSTNSGVVEDHVKIQKLEKEKMLMKDLCRARSRRIKELEDRLKELEEPQSYFAPKPSETSQEKSNQQYHSVT